MAVLETARGGMLLRGIGVLHNDVAVVTNVSADHLGLHGVETVDQLAEVKSHHPHHPARRVGRAERRRPPRAGDATDRDGRPWLFSTHPDHPALREALREGGRAMSIQDGRSPGSPAIGPTP